jgi:hypothetical protein
MYFLYKNEYGTLKPIEVTLRRGGGEGGRIMKEMNQLEI